MSIPLSGACIEVTPLLVGPKNTRRTMHRTHPAGAIWLKPHWNRPLALSGFAVGENGCSYKQQRDKG